MQKLLSSFLRPEFIPFLVFGLLLAGCGEAGLDKPTGYKKVSGETMGTTYHITCRDTTGRTLKPRIDSLLRQLNQEVSTYIPTSTISRFNQTDSIFDLEYNFELMLSSKSDPKNQELLRQNKNKHFLANFIVSQEVYQRTAGYFDPTVMPLVNYWGFGYTPKKPVSQVDSAMVDSLLQLVGLERVIQADFGKKSLLRKAAPGVQLDFSAVAKGHGVDIIGLVLESLGIKNYMVEIGGEVRARGVNPEGKPWTIGISTPQEGAAVDDFQRIVGLQDLSLATSGNYRNFYEVDGVKFSHTINPRTGFPERNKLLSASVFTTDCRTADAYATAFMVMGLERSKQLVKRLKGIDAYLIFGKADGSIGVWESEGLSERLGTLE